MLERRVGWEELSTMETFGVWRAGSLSSSGSINLCVNNGL